MVHCSGTADPTMTPWEVDESKTVMALGEEYYDRDSPFFEQARLSDMRMMINQCIGGLFSIRVRVRTGIPWRYRVQSKHRSQVAAQISASVGLGVPRSSAVRTVSGEPVDLFGLPSRGTGCVSLLTEDAQTEFSHQKGEQLELL